MRAGTLTRELVWATDAGKHVRVRSRRMVSLEHRHLVAMTYEVTMLDEAAPVVVSSLVLNRQDARQTDDLPEYRPGDPRLATVLPHRVLNVRAAELAEQRILLGYQTTSSGMTLGVGVDHVIDAACSSAGGGVPRRRDGRGTPHGRCGAGRPDPDHQVRDLPDLAQHPGPRARRPVPPDPGPRGPGRVRRARRGSARESRPVLGPRRRAGAGPAQSGAAAAGGPVESLPDRAGVLARRRGRSPGEGADRAGLRGPLLLGYRGLRPAVPVLHPAQDRPEPAAVPAQHARPRAGAGGRDEPARARCSRGGPSTARRPRPISSRAPPSITSTPISLTRSCATPTWRAADACSARSARKSSSRPPGCGRTSASTAPTRNSTSTA